MIYKRTGRWMWQGNAPVVSWSWEKYSCQSKLVSALSMLVMEYFANNIMWHSKGSEWIATSWPGRSSDFVCTVCDQPIKQHVYIVGSNVSCLFLDFEEKVPVGSPSRGGDVTVYVCDINQPSLPTSFYSVLVSISVFMALSTVFHSIFLPTAVFWLFFRSYFCLSGPFNCISLY